MKLFWRWCVISGNKARALIASTGIICASILAFNGVDGWGWILLVVVVLLLTH